MRQMNGIEPAMQAGKFFAMLVQRVEDPAPKRYNFAQDLTMRPKDARASVITARAQNRCRLSLKNTSNSTGRSNLSCFSWLMRLSRRTGRQFGAPTALLLKIENAGFAAGFIKLRNPQTPSRSFALTPKRLFTLSETRAACSVALLLATRRSFAGALERVSFCQAMFGRCAVGALRPDALGAHGRRAKHVQS